MFRRIVVAIAAILTTLAMTAVPADATHSQATVWSQANYQGTSANLPATTICTRIRDINGVAFTAWSAKNHTTGALTLRLWANTTCSGGPIVALIGPAGEASSLATGAVSYKLG